MKHTGPNPGISGFEDYVAKRSASSYTDESTRRLLKSILKWAQKEARCVEDLQDYIFSTRGPKEHAKDLILEFYDAYEKQHPDDKIETSLREICIIDDATRRMIEEVKYLQEPRTIAQLCARFGLSARSVRRDLSTIESGFTVMGSEIRIKTVTVKRRKTLQTFMQPVYLSLTRAEMYSMTKGLACLAQTDPVYGKSLERIASRVYGQLTKEQQAALEMENSAITNDFTEGALEMLGQDLGFRQQLILMLNEGKRGILYFNEDGRYQQFENCRLLSYRKGEETIEVETAEGEWRFLRAESIYDCELC